MGQFIICVTTHKNIGIEKCYLGQPLDSNWIQMCDKENAERFNSKQEAETFIKQNKIIGVETEQI